MSAQHKHVFRGFDENNSSRLLSALFWMAHTAWQPDTIHHTMRQFEAGKEKCTSLRCRVLMASAASSAVSNSTMPHPYQYSPPQPNPFFSSSQHHIQQKRNLDHPTIDRTTPPKRYSHSHIFPDLPSPGEDPTASNAAHPAQITPITKPTPSHGFPHL